MKTVCIGIGIHKAIVTEFEMKNDFHWVVKKVFDLRSPNTEEVVVIVNKNVLLILGK